MYDYVPYSSQPFRGLNFCYVPCLICSLCSSGLDYRSQLPCWERNASEVGLFFWLVLPFISCNKLHEQRKIIRDKHAVLVCATRAHHFHFQNIFFSFDTRLQVYWCSCFTNKYPLSCVFDGKDVAVLFFYYFPLKK